MSRNSFDWVGSAGADVSSSDSSSGWASEDASSSSKSELIEWREYKDGFVDMFLGRSWGRDLAEGILGELCSARIELDGVNRRSCERASGVPLGNSAKGWARPSLG
jgi:hypothetical protein